MKFGLPEVVLIVLLASLGVVLHRRKGKPWAHWRGDPAEMVALAILLLLFLVSSTLPGGLTPSLRLTFLVALLVAGAWGFVHRLQVRRSKGGRPDN